MNKLIILLFAFLFASCSMQKLCEKCPKKTEVKDTTIYITKINTRVDSIYLPSDFATFEAWLKCDSIGNVYLSQINELQRQKVKVNTIYKDNYIKVNCNTDSLLLLIASKDSTIDKIKNTTIKEIVYQKEKYIPFWIYFIISILLLLLIYKFFKC